MTMEPHLLVGLPAVVEPAHTAILVIDVQNDFCADGGHTQTNLKKDVAACQAVAAPIMDLVAAGRSAGALIVWVRADYDHRYLPPPILAKQRQKGISSAYCVAGTWGAAFYQVSPTDGDYVIDKHRHSAFAGTELDQILRDRGIASLIVTGVQTHVCVESTLRDGSARGYYIVVPGDCVGSFDRELHDTTLRSVDMHFGEVTTGATLIDLWATAHAGRDLAAPAA